MLKGSNRLKTIVLHKICSEFCTERTSPGLDTLHHEVQSALDAGETIQIDRSGVKILTTSFIDELLSALAVRFTIEKVRNQILFSPELEPMHWEQVERGVRLRSRT